MWEQKNKPPLLVPAQAPASHHHNLVPPASTPHLRPHLCSLLPGPHIREAQYVQTLIRISLRGRGREEK